MLTRAHRVYRWLRPGSSISSDRLEAETLPVLARAIDVYRARIGETLGAVRNAARRALAELRPDRVEPVVDVLDSAVEYAWPRSARQAERRVRVFTAAAREHPVLDAARARAILVAELAGAGEAPEPGDDPVALLYADYPEYHRLHAVPAAYGPEELRADYDLAQAQALLYDATRLEVEARGDFQHILRYAHLARLLYRIERSAGPGYRLTLDGPTSVLRQTRAYGVDFARFLAALVQARGWQMTAEIVLRRGRRPVSFALADTDGLRSRVPAPALFDSGLEERLARKFGAEREGWRLVRGGMILDAGATALVPDFLFVHADGTEVALEIVGYWTPEYLRAKLARLRRVRGAPNLLLAVPAARRLAPGALDLPVIEFRTTITLAQLLPRLEAFRQPR